MNRITMCCRATAGLALGCNAGTLARARLSTIVSHDMRSVRRLFACALLVAALLVTIYIFRQPRDPTRLKAGQIASALVQMHYCWETNGYHSPQSGVPETL